MDTSTFERWYKCTATFEYFNANPLGAKKRGYQWDRGDCAVRALAKAADISWLNAYDYLNERARRDYNVLNDTTAYRGWIEEGGAQWVAVKAEKGKERMTAEDFCKSHPKGRYILHLASHETAVVDGKIYDVWNCGERCVYGYLVMAKFAL